LLAVRVLDVIPSSETNSVLNKIFSVYTEKIMK
jgi:hypothetical protein